MEGAIKELNQDEGNQGMEKNINNIENPVSETSDIGKKKEIIRKRRSVKEILLRGIVLFIGAMVTAAGLEIFLIPNQVIDGGVVGISIMGSHITGFPYTVFLLCLNAPFVYLGYKRIGKSFAFCTIFANIALSFWANVFEPMTGVTEDFFLAAIFGGIITGIGVGIIIRNGGSLDGTEIVAIILDKKTSFSVGEMVLFFNLFILGSAGFVFSWDKAMYSLVAYFVISKMIDIVQKGLDESYAVMIVSDKHKEIADDLMQKLGRGVTYLSGEGAYTGNSKKVIYCVVTRLELNQLKEIAYEKDESVFVTVNAVHEIVGGRFKQRKSH